MLGIYATDRIKKIAKLIKHNSTDLSVKLSGVQEFVVRACRFANWHEFVAVAKTPRSDSDPRFQAIMRVSFLELELSLSKQWTEAKKIENSDTSGERGSA